MSFFERITDGLRLYEVVLLMMGSIMFLVLVIMLIIYASQRRTLKPLLIFFAVPVLMLVWPSIQKMKIDETGVEFDKAVAKMQQDPSEENKVEVKKILSTLESRNVKDPDVRTNVAVAQYLLGDAKAAEATIATLPPKAVMDPRIKDIKTSIAVNTQLKEQLEVVQQNPNDSTQVKELDRIQTKAEQLPIKNDSIKSTIRISENKIIEYKRINPRIDIRRFQLPR
ncbi:MAG TPA: tetratricopeptide repeat protein [Chitinophagaceae bacterium]|jgi:hypothetical protein|nr:tetratricopeptide repeat protein [Chitinophagaceae bacterium]